MGLAAWQLVPTLQYNADSGGMEGVIGSWAREAEQYAGRVRAGRGRGPGRGEPGGGRAVASRAWARVMMAGPTVGRASACEEARVLRVSVSWEQLEKVDASRHIPCCSAKARRSGIVACLQLSGRARACGCRACGSACPGGHSGWSLSCGCASRSGQGQGRARVEPAGRLGPTGQGRKSDGPDRMGRETGPSVGQVSLWTKVPGP